MQANSTEEQQVSNTPPTTMTVGVPSRLVDQISANQISMNQKGAPIPLAAAELDRVETDPNLLDRDLIEPDLIEPDLIEPAPPHPEMGVVETSGGVLTRERSCFHGNFVSCMEMYATAQQVGAYLDAHREWFPRCAYPMKIQPIGKNGYDLLIGRFGSFGYEVEARIGLDLLPGQAGIYRIETIPVPGYEPVGYEVDFKAALALVEIDQASPLFPQLTKGAIEAQIPDCITRVEWELHLQVTVQFPRFIQALPKNLVQTTGDRLLNQIVRQVSRCLTHKVQDDFHTSLGLPFPKKRLFGRLGKD